MAAFFVIKAKPAMQKQPYNAQNLFIYLLARLFRNTIMKTTIKFAAVTAIALSSLSAHAGLYCVFDPLGTQGPAFGIAKDFALVAKQWGIPLTLKAYTDERVVTEDFKAGQCDGIAVTTLRGRQFNHFVGSLDSVGAVPTNKHLRVALQALASPQMAPAMTTGQYEVIGVAPLGGAYIMVRDRAINSIEKAAGKKIAVLDYDKSQAKMAQQMGLQPVASDITSFAANFNNGQVDIIAAPAIAYKPFEIYKGLGTTGAVYRFPLIQMTGMMIIRKDKWPADLGAKARAYSLTQLDRAEVLAKQAEDTIPANYWMELSAADKAKYVIMMRESRILLTQDGTYDPKMMKLLKKVRCKLDASAAECSDNVE